MGSEPEKQMWLPLVIEGELFHAETATETPAGNTQVMEGCWSGRTCSERSNESGRTKAAEVSTEWPSRN